MRSNSQHRQDVTAKHCAICNGRFGLIRHHCWQTALCSKRCVERLKARQEGDRKWLSWPRAA
jgi:hypothetical protein